MTDAAPPALRILVAVADRGARLIAMRLLARLGHVARDVDGEAAARAALQVDAFDVLLLDLALPDLDVRATTGWIRSALPAGHRPWLVGLVAPGDDAEREAGRAAGLDDQLAKPLRPEPLAEVLLRAVVPGRGAPGTGTAAAGPEDPPVLDLARLAELEANLGPAASVVLPEIFAEFSPEAVRLVAEARRAVAAGQLVELRRLAHTLKGAGANLGLAALSTVARELEGQARDGVTDGLEALAERLAREVERAVQALAQRQR